MKIPKVSIIGTGKVAFHLLNMFQGKLEVVQLLGRDEKDLEELNSRYNVATSLLYDNIAPADVYIICVSDQAISIVAQQLSPHVPNDGVLCHTSGTVSLRSISTFWHNAGSLYPLQTFSQNRIPNYHPIPIFLTGNNEHVFTHLKSIADTLGSNTFKISDDQKQHLHLSAVVVNNHVNHLLLLAKDYCEDHNIDFKYLFPLLQETVKKSKIIGPRSAQTGPARRQDDKTVQTHIEHLEDYPMFQEIYSAISDSIALTYYHEDH